MCDSTNGARLSTKRDYSYGVLAEALQERTLRRTTWCVSGQIPARQTDLVPAKARNCQTAFSAEGVLPYWCTPATPLKYIYPNAPPTTLGSRFTFLHSISVQDGDSR